jgi:hypothetical protein
MRDAQVEMSHDRLMDLGEIGLMGDKYSWSRHGSLTSHHTIQIVNTLEAAGISGESAITND